MREQQRDQQRVLNSHIRRVSRNADPYARLKYCTLVLVILLLVIAVGYLIKKIQFLENQIERNQETIARVKQGLFSNLTTLQYNLQQKINRLESDSQKHQEKITMLIENQLSQQIKEYDFMAKNSRKLTWSILNQTEDTFKKYYKKISENPLTIAKNSPQGSGQISNLTSFNNNYRSFVQMRIYKTKYSNIYIGAFIEDPQAIYIFNLKDRNIYKGQYYNTLSIVKTSNSQLTINANDTVTLLHDTQLRQLVWYVNKKYASHIALPHNYTGYVFPIIKMQTQGDIVSIL